MYLTMNQFIDKYDVTKVRLSRAVAQEELVRGVHVTSDNGVASVFDEEKTVARLRELGVLKSPERLA